MWMRTWLPVRVESLWWMRRLRRLLRVLGTLPLVLDATAMRRHSLGRACEFALAVPSFASRGLTLSQFLCGAACWSSEPSGLLPRN